MDSIVNVTSMPTGKRQPTHPQLAITCIGALKINCDGRPMLAWPNQKARELLAYLATCDNGQASRQAVQAALWPSVTEQWAAQGLLRTALWQVRRRADRHDTPASPDTTRFAHSIIVNKGNLLLLNPQRCASDYAELCTERDTLLRSELSATHADGDTIDSTAANAFAHRWLSIADACNHPICAGETFTWLDALNGRQREWRLDALERSCRFAERANDPALMAHVLECRLRSEPLHEPTLAALMRMRLSQGQTAEVVAHYRAFRQALARHADDLEGVAALASAEIELLYQAALSNTSCSPNTPSTGTALDHRKHQQQTALAVEMAASAHSPYARPPP